MIIFFDECCPPPPPPPQEDCSCLGIYIPSRLYISIWDFECGTFQSNPRPSCLHQFRTYMDYGELPPELGLGEKGWYGDGVDRCDRPVTFVMDCGLNFYVTYCEYTNLGPLSNSCFDPVCGLSLGCVCNDPGNWRWSYNFVTLGGENVCGESPECVIVVTEQVYIPNTPSGSVGIDCCDGYEPPSTLWLTVESGMPCAESASPIELTYYASSPPTPWIINETNPPGWFSSTPIDCSGDDLSFRIACHGGAEERNWGLTSTCFGTQFDLAEWATTSSCDPLELTFNCDFRYLFTGCEVTLPVVINVTE